MNWKLCPQFKIWSASTLTIGVIICNSTNDTFNLKNVARIYIFSMICKPDKPSSVNYHFKCFKHNNLNVWAWFCSRVLRECCQFCACLLAFITNSRSVNKGTQSNTQMWMFKIELMYDRNQINVLYYDDGLGIETGSAPCFMVFIAAKSQHGYMLCKDVCIMLFGIGG